jgi:hypothetical protein
MISEVTPRLDTTHLHSKGQSSPSTRILPTLTLLYPSISLSHPTLSLYLLILSLYLLTPYHPRPSRSSARSTIRILGEDPAPLSL